MPPVNEVKTMRYMLALQPVFLKDRGVFSYQVVYKNAAYYDGEHLYSYTLEMINATGIEKISRGKPSMIQFTSDAILKKIPYSMPVHEVIIDLKKPLIVKDELIAHLTDLKQKNYMICMDEYVFQSQYKQLLVFADMIKLNFSKTYADRNKAIALVCIQNHKSIVATHLEKPSEFDFAKQVGCKYYVGTFFCEPEWVELREIAAFKFNYLQLIKRVNEPTMDFEKIAEIISQDVSLSYKLLRIVNSVAFGFQRKIESIKQAAVVLGEKELKKWVSFLAINGIVEDKPNEVVRLSLFRAKFSEHLAQQTSLKKKVNEVFMMGLFSMLDVMMGRPLEELLQDLHLSDDVVDALLKGEGPYREIFDLVIAYERCQWERVDELMNKMEIEENSVIDAYLKANGWSNELLEETHGKGRI